MKKCCACHRGAIGIRREAILDGLRPRARSKNVLFAHHTPGKTLWLCDIHLKHYDEQCLNQEAERAKSFDRKCSSKDRARKAGVLQLIRTGR